jgi:hypothetical protein
LPYFQFACCSSNHDAVHRHVVERLLHRRSQSLGAQLAATHRCASTPLQSSLTAARIVPQLANFRSDRRSGQFLTISATSSNRQNFLIIIELEHGC